MTQDERKLSIDLEEIDSIPLVMVKDPEYCFKGITTPNEFEFIKSLGTKEWNEIGWKLMDFDKFTQTVVEHIQENYKTEIISFTRNRKIDELTE